MGPPAAPPQAPKVKHYDLRKGTYSVAVNVGKQRQTALQEGQESLGALLQAEPQLVPILGDLLFKYSTFPGHDQVAKRLAKWREKMMPGLDDTDETPSPEAAAAENAQLKQQIQQMAQQLQQAVMMIKNDQAKQQAQLVKTQMDNATKERIAAGEQQTQILLKQIERSIAELKASTEAQRTAQQAVDTHTSHVQDSFEKEAQRAHEVTEAEKDRMHEAVMAIAAPSLEEPEPPEPPAEG